MLTFGLISDLISIMTGGEAEIQDIQPYYGDLNGVDAFDYSAIEVDFARTAKTVSAQPKK